MKKKSKKNIKMINMRINVDWFHRFERIRFDSVEFDWIWLNLIGFGLRFYPKYYRLFSTLRVDNNDAELLSCGNANAEISTGICTSKLNPIWAKKVETKKMNINLFKLQLNLFREEEGDTVTRRETKLLVSGSWSCFQLHDGCSSGLAPKQASLRLLVAVLERLGEFASFCLLPIAGDIRLRHHDGFKSVGRRVMVDRSSSPVICILTLAPLCAKSNPSSTRYSHVPPEMTGYPDDLEVASKSLRRVKRLSNKSSMRPMTEQRRSSVRCFAWTTTSLREWKVFLHIAVGLQGF